MKKTIYIASKTKHAPMWRLARQLGAPIISTWIDEPDPSPDFEMLWCRCIEEAAAADFVVLYAQHGEVFKGALVECGAALAAGRTVIQVGVCESLKAGDGSDASFTSHPNWRRVEDIANAFAFAYEERP